MSTTLNEEEKKSFTSLIEVMELKDIRFLDIHSQVLHATNEEKNENDAEKGKVEGARQVSWKQQFADEDPVRDADRRLFRPRYEFTITRGDQKEFKAVFIALIVFQVTDENKFSEAWEQPNVKEFFLQKQILRTMWTILRAQMFDVMNRHSLRPVSLPWLIL